MIDRRLEYSGDLRRSVLAGEIFAPAAVFVADAKIGIVPLPFPKKRRRRIKANTLPPKSDFSRFEDNPENDISKRCGKHRSDNRGKPRIGSH